MITATNGATIRYTTDGSTPSSTSTVYTGPVVISTVGTHTIKALAAKTDMVDSSTTSQTFTVLEQIAAPTISPTSSTAYATSVSVTLATTSTGATIYYTLDGTDPATSSSTRSTFTAPHFTITTIGATTVKAWAMKNGATASTVTSATYTVQSKVATPTFTPDGGSATGSLRITISSTTADCIIRYTSDGTLPTGSSLQYSNGLTLPVGSWTVKAIGYKTDFFESNVATSIGYTVKEQVGTPVITPAGGDHSSSITITLHVSTGSATIRFTTDGNEPTEQSSVYASPFVWTPTGTMTVKAKAFKSGATESALASAVFREQTSAVVFTPGGGSYIAPLQVTLTSATSGASIYYTDGTSTPTTSSTKYSEAMSFTLPGTFTIKSFATKAGAVDSAVISATYVIGQIAAPTISPAGGTVSGSVTVTITANPSAPSNTVMYYTTDNSTPTMTSSTSVRYTQPFVLSSTATVKTVAFSDSKPSTVVQATYTVSAQLAMPVFTPTPGSTLEGGVRVTIAAPNTAAQVYFTTNGANPSASSTMYSSPIDIATIGSYTFKAIAVLSGHTDSPIASATFTVKACPKGTFQSGVSCLSCPANAYTEAEGATSITSCTCNPGYSGANGGVCTACPVGTYKDRAGASACIACNVNSTTVAAASTVSTHCRCKAGYTGLDGESCAACPVGQYKPEIGPASCSSCPTFSTTASVGSTLTSHCQCLPGYTGTDGGTCSACPVGTYKVSAGSQGCFSCGSSSTTTVVAAASATACVCLPGYSGPNGGSACQACPVGSYKSILGASACVSCPASSSTALSASTSSALCVCNAGHTSVGGVCLEDLQSPLLNPMSGTFAAGRVEVVMTPRPAAAEVRYTLDGSTPTTSSLLFKSPNVVITTVGTTTVRAITVRGSATSTETRATLTVQAVVTIKCGDGKLEGTEACDDGNSVAGDGCSPTCAVETGFVCSSAGCDCAANYFPARRDDDGKGLCRNLCTSSATCSARGKCSLVGGCVCPDFYFGAKCEIYTPPEAVGEKVIADKNVAASLALDTSGRNDTAAVSTKVELQIPAAALPSTYNTAEPITAKSYPATAIQTMSLASEKKNVALKPVAKVVHFGPDGLKFDKPCPLEMPFDSSSVASEDLGKMSVHTFVDDKGTWEDVGGVCSAVTGKCTASLSHFSLYTVMLKSNVEPAVPTAGTSEVTAGSSGGSSNGLSIGAIVGITFAVVVVGIAAVLGIVLWSRRRYTETPVMLSPGSTKSLAPLAVPYAVAVDSPTGGRYYETLNSPVQSPGRAFDEEVELSSSLSPHKLVSSPHNRMPISPHGVHAHGATTPPRPGRASLRDSLQARNAALGGAPPLSPNSVRSSRMTATADLLVSPTHQNFVTVPMPPTSPSPRGRSSRHGHHSRSRSAPRSARRETNETSEAWE